MEERPMFGTVFVSLAQSAGEVKELLDWLRQKKRPEPLRDAPGVDGWLALYREHRRVWRVFVEKVFGSLLGEPEAGEKLIAGLMELERLGAVPHAGLEDELETMGRESWGRLQELFEGLARALMVDMEQSVGEAQTGDLDELLVPEVQFVLHVWVPCWYETGQHPVQVLRKARAGDLDSLEAILRIDKAACQDKRIAQEILEARWANPARWERLSRAIEGDMVRKLSMKKVKCSLAGLISNVSERLGGRLSHIEIRDLFDAVSKDSMGHIDLDLPDDPAAFRKAIYRERKFWKIPKIPVLPI